MSLWRPSTTKRHFAVGCLLAWLTCALADITCTSPNTGTFKEGDPITLSWGNSGGSPQLIDVTSMKGALFCDTGPKIADLPTINWAGPMSWTVPSVGNSTAPLCIGNSFHVEYSGTYRTFVLTKDFGPVKCQSITIAPSPGAVTTTTTTTTKATATKTSTSSTSSPTETDKSESDDSSKGNSSVIVIVGIVAGLIFFLVIFGTWWHLRRKKLKRMESAIMPWSSQPSNPFSKVPSMDGGDRNGGSNKPQPAAPSPAHHQDDYGRHGAAAGGGGYGYDGYNAHGQQDEYYNPYYAQNMHQGQGQGYGGGHAGMMDPSYGNGSPYQDYNDPYQKQPGGGYYPPPPGSSSASHAPMTKSASNMGFGSPALSSGNLTTSSSMRRGPQVILPEKGSPYDDEGAQQIPMKDLTPKA